MQHDQSANSELLAKLDELQIQALIFDLDGVVTPTAEIHARAWQKMFNEYLRKKSQSDGKTYRLMNIPEDYPKYLDGISRHDGIRNFLKSRGIFLPEGMPDNGPETESIFGLGNWKNRYFRQVLENDGIQAYPDTLNFIRSQKAKGRRTAIISASKNCRDILKTAEIEYLFEVRVDGLLAEELHLKSKPAPDIFLEAARQLQVSPAHAAVFEDARAGVQAGKAGGFGFVTAINRGSVSETVHLLQNGADLVISHF